MEIKVVDYTVTVYHVPGTVYHTKLFPARPRENQIADWGWGK